MTLLLIYNFGTWLKNLLLDNLNDMTYHVIGRQYPNTHLHQEVAREGLAIAAEP